MILTDAGPLIALLRADDAWHASCVEAARKLPGPMVTVWPAFTEAMHVVATWRAQRALLQLLEEKALTLLPLGEEEIPRIRELMEQYRDTPMDLADAALVCVAERERLTKIFTLDRRGFSAYRMRDGRRFRVVP